MATGGGDIGKAGINQAEHVGNKRQHPRLDKDRNSNRLDNDIRRNAGNAIPRIADMIMTRHPARYT